MRCKLLCFLLKTMTRSKKKALERVRFIVEFI